MEAGAGVGEGMEVGAGAGAGANRRHCSVGFGVGTDTSGTTIRSLWVANQIAPILTARTTANAAASANVFDNLGSFAAALRAPLPFAAPRPDDLPLALCSKLKPGSEGVASLLLKLKGEPHATLSPCCSSAWISPSFSAFITVSTAAI